MHYVRLQQYNSAPLIETWLFNLLGKLGCLKLGFTLCNEVKKSQKRFNLLTLPDVLLYRRPHSKRIGCLCEAFEIDTKTLISFYLVNLIDFFVNIPGLFWIWYQQSFSNGLGKGQQKRAGSQSPRFIWGISCTSQHVFIHGIIILFCFSSGSYLYNSSVWVAESKSSAPHLTRLFQILYLTSFMKLFSLTTHLLVLTHRKDDRAAGEGESAESKRAAATLLKFFGKLYSLRITLLWSTWALTKKTIQARLCRLCKDCRRLVDNILFNAFNSH